MNVRHVRLMRAINALAGILDDPRFHTPTIKPLRTDLERLVVQLRDQMSTQLAASVSLSSASRGVARLKG
ncbi:MAG TPA: hypothetical protein VGQ44_01800 [Gemmatimonadaceae bacterium]|jgi:hypothetical protein|nr:hypothetical protein [Gemmatimonadaceae bacterium]